MAAACVGHGADLGIRRTRLRPAQAAISLAGGGGDGDNASAMAKAGAESYCLVQSNLQGIDPQVLKVAFRSVGELVDNDAKILSADAFGILADGLSAESARTLANELARLGVTVEVVSEQAIPKLPDSHTLRRGGCYENVFMATDSLGRDEPVDWSRVVLLSAGIVPIREAKRIVRTRYKSALSLPVTGGACLGMMLSPTGAITAAYLQAAYGAPERDVSIRYKTKSHGIVDVFVDCEPYYYRIVGDKFNYSYLGQRRSRKKLENFAMMVGDLVSGAQGAALNRGAVAIRDEGLEAKFAYPTRHAFEEETIWLLYKFGLVRGRAWPWMNRQ